MPLLPILPLMALGAADSSSQIRTPDGVSIHYQSQGTGDPAIVLVHGWALDRHLWDGQIAHLAQEHRVVALDLAGHGESGRNRTEWTMGALGQDVKAVVDAIGTKKVVLVGHSMGGNVVVEAARRMPDRVQGIVLVDTLLDVEELTPADEVEAMARGLEADYKATTAQMTNQYLFAGSTPAAVRDRVLSQATSMNPKISIALLRSSWTYDAQPALRAIKAPIRAVNADTFPTNVEANRRHMPGYEAVIVSGTGHYPMLEDPARFDAAFAKALGMVLAAKH